jgi:hypothetical protein
VLAIDPVKSVNVVVELVDDRGEKLLVVVPQRR